tara:strand:+ start:200 stop:2032 length:1833 start_codon:yes stop_codon:yes gene_type:complete
VRGVMLVGFLSFLSQGYADPAASYQEGQRFGSGGIAPPTSAAQNTVPGFATTSPSESHLDAHALGEAAQARMDHAKEGSAEDLVKSSSAVRPRFSIKASDPLITNANKVVATPEEYVGALKEEERHPEKEVVTRHRCQVSPEMTLHVEEELLVKPVLLKQKIEVGRRWEKTRWKESRWISGKVNPLSVRERQTLRYWFEEYNWHHEFYDIYYDYQLCKGHLNQDTGEFETGDWTCVTKEEYDAAPEAEGHEGWKSVTPGAEAMALKNECQVVAHHCLEGPQTKIIEGVPVFKECWRRETVYKCQGPKKDGCRYLQDRGCTQLDSKCLQTEEGRCTVYENLYECMSRHGELTRLSFKGDVPYCLDGNCAETGYAANQDLAEVLSKLAIFREIQKDMVEAMIFKGTREFCDKHMIGFSDCCQKSGGWGTSLKLSKCKLEEKELSKKRNAGKCVYVGTFCAEKLPVVGTCIRKRSHHCCFTSKLARLVQEQGRRQLGLNFGTAEEPDCRPLSVHELARLDFSKIDLRELFEDLTRRVSVPDPAKVIQTFKEDWQERLPGISSDLPEENTMKEQIRTRKKAIGQHPGQFTTHRQDHHPDPHSEIAATRESKVVF